MIEPYGDGSGAHSEPEGGEGWRQAIADADLIVDLPESGSQGSGESMGGPMFFRWVVRPEQATQAALAIAGPGAASERNYRRATGVETQWVPATYLIGSRGEYDDEEPIHRVYLTQPYLMASLPTTQRQFRSWTASDAYREWPGANEYDREPDRTVSASQAECPAGDVSWFEARSFCAWLSDRIRDELQLRGPVLDDLGAIYRMGGRLTADLPTEYEWEHACRAGTTTEYWSGDGEAALRTSGWFSGNAGGMIHAVGGKEPNGFGLYDMHGNVWEWCLDRVDANAYRDCANGVDASAIRLRALEGTESTSRRVLRGGSWLNSARDCRSAYRGRFHPGLRGRSGGFRVCLLPGPLVPSQTDQTGCGAAQADEGGGGGTPPDP